MQTELVAVEATPTELVVDSAKDAAVLAQIRSALLERVDRLLSDLDNLPVPDFKSSLELVVVDAASRQGMKDRVREALDHKAHVGEILEGPTSAANKFHKFFTGLRRARCADADRVIEHGSKQIDAWDIEDARKRREAAAAHQRQQEEAAAAQRKAAEDAAREAAATAAALADLGIDVEETQPLPPPMPPILSAPITIPPVTPNDKNNGVWIHKVEDFGALLEFISGVGVMREILKDAIDHKPELTREQLIERMRRALCVPMDPLATEILQVNDIFAKAKARRLEESLGERFPGLSASRKQHMNWRK